MYLKREICGQRNHTNGPLDPLDPLEIRRFMNIGNHSEMILGALKQIVVYLKPLKDTNVQRGALTDGGTHPIHKNFPPPAPHYSS